ncbi:MAG: hypothetical protein WAM70_20290, partial [Pyrinomonadaceae bacterium]
KQMCRPTATSASATSGGAASCITGTSTAGKAVRNHEVELKPNGKFALNDKRFTRVANFPFHSAAQSVVANHNALKNLAIRSPLNH